MWVRIKVGFGYGKARVRPGLGHAHAYHVLCEARLLPVVHDDDLVPVLGHFGQAEGAAQVDQVEDVLVTVRVRG